MYSTIIKKKRTEFNKSDSLIKVFKKSNQKIWNIRYKYSISENREHEYNELTIVITKINAGEKLKILKPRSQAFFFFTKLIYNGKP